MRKIINTNLAECNKCNLANIDCPVLARGNYNIPIMIVGDTPNKFDQNNLLPFVGVQGKMLENMLNSIGISSQDCYITNINKCYFDNTPNTKQKNNCYPWLYEEIISLNPKLIITLGNIAMRYILQNNKLNISNEHGKIKITGLVLPETINLSSKKKLYTIKTFNILPLYHPNSLIRQNTKNPGSIKYQTWIDLQQIKSRD